MKKLILSNLIVFSLISCSSDGLQSTSTIASLNYDNGSLVTGKVSSTGVQAPTGFSLSELENGYINLGFYSFTHPTIQNRRHYIGDDFVVPLNETWNIDEFTFYFFKGLEEDMFPVNAVMLEIYDGDPRLNTSHKIFGDFSTNLFLKSQATDVYRIAYNSNSLSEAHQVYSVKAKIPNLNLQSGHYYFKMTTKYEGANFFYFAPHLPQSKVKNNNGFYFVVNNLNETYFTTDPDSKFDFPFLINGTKTIN